MSLATLKAVEQQLAASLDAAQRHLQVASALDTSVPCSADVIDKFQSLAGEIERLQTELQTVVVSVITHSRQKRVVQVAETLNDQIQASNVNDEETETEDESVDPKSIRQAQNTQKERKPVTKEKMATALQRFVQRTGDAVAALENGKHPNQIGNVCGACRLPTANFAQLLQTGEAVDEAAAGLYRDTLVKFAEVASDVRASGRLHVKSLTRFLKQLEVTLKLTEDVAEAPVALSGDEVRAAQLKLRKYAGDHAEDKLTKIHKYVDNLLKQKRALSGGALETTLKRLTIDVQVELTTCIALKEIGLFSRSEERWAIFTEVTEALGDWIGRLAMASKPPKELKHIFRFVLKFDKQFPGRVPPILIENMRMRLRFSKQQEQQRRKGKNRKKK